MIGDKIKARREELGLTQSELASKMGYAHKTSISKIENNKTDVNISDVEKLAIALDTTPQYLMGWTSEPESHSKRVKYEGLISAYSTADDKTRDIVDRLLDINLLAARPNANPDAGDSDFIENDQEDMNKEWD